MSRISFVCALAGILLTRGSSAWAQSEWKTYRAGGLTVSHPTGWRVEESAGGVVSVSQPDGSATALAHPFLAREGETARAWLAQAPATLSEHFPNARIVRSGAGDRADSAMASLSYQRGGRRFEAALLCSVDGRSGMLFAVSSAADRFQALRPTLVRILQSLRYSVPSRTAATAGAASPSLSYSRWQDPREGAFSLEIPQGWHAQGGMYHRSALDPRVSVMVTSTDGATLLEYGDASLPAYHPMTQMLAASGFREGSVYSIGAGQSYVIQRFVSGVDYGRNYLRQRISGAYSDLKVLQAKDRPDIAQRLEALWNSGGQAMVRYIVNVGELDFTCSHSGRPMQGTLYMLTVMQAAGGFTPWAPVPIGFVAPPDHTAAADAAIRRMAASFTMSSDWLARQSQTAVAVSHIATETGHEMSRVIDESYWKNEATKDNMARQRSNANLGLTDVVDPETGEKYKVASGHNYYWRRGDQVVGTETFARPDIDFTPLKEW